MKHLSFEEEEESSSPLDSMLMGWTPPPDLDDDDDDKDDLPQDREAVQEHAKYVEGSVGMVRAGKALPLRIVAGLRNGVLVINLADGGSLRFYKLFKKPLRYVKEHLRLNEAASRLSGGVESIETHLRSSLNQRNSIFLRNESSRMSIMADPEASIFHRDKTHGRDELDVTEKMKKKIDKVAVFASTQDFVEPAEMPYLYIPADVPWRFKSVNSFRNNSFQIVVPPDTMGNITRKDERVKIMTYRDKIRNIKKITTFVDGEEVTFATVLQQTGHEDDEGEDYEYKDDDSASEASASAWSSTKVLGSKKYSQVFQFCCDKDELAVYAKAAQSLGRVLADNKYQTTAKAIVESNVRVRNAGRMEIAAQLRTMERSKSVANFRDRRISSVDELEYRVTPLHAYPYTWMTKKELAVELTRRSKNFVDLRQNSVGEIGSIRVEILQCIGLPKMDKYSLSDAFCYIVCGSNGFCTDTIPDNLNPAWLPRTRRACIFPLHNAYSQVYVGVFDYDGENESDDFIGRVVVDTQQLKSGFSYDITLPLRDTSRVYYRKRLGSVRLRLELHWSAGERAALLSYLPRSPSCITKRLTTRPLEPTTTLICPDSKSFTGVGFTVYGEDVPGKYSAHIKNAMSREVAMINKIMFFKGKKIVKDIATWKNPLLSLYIFWAWMYMVVYNAFDNVPSFVLSLVFIALLRNYVKYNVNSAVGSLYGHRTIGDMLRILLFNRDDTEVSMSQLQRLSNRPILERILLKIFGMTFTAKQKKSWQAENHSEFPFSSGSVYPKISSDEAAKSHVWSAAENITDSMRRGTTNTVLEWDSDEDDSSSNEDEWSFDEGIAGDIRSSIVTVKKGIDKNLDLASKLGKKSNSPRPQNDENSLQKSPSEDSMATGKSRRRRSIDRIESNEYYTVATKKSDMVRGTSNATKSPVIPEQNMGVKTKFSSTIIGSIEKMHAKASKASLHLFDDRVFVVDDKAEAEKLLHINTTNNPIAKKMNPIMGAFLKLIDIELCAFRALFNVIMWKDPLLSFWVTLFVFILMVVLLVFPWRLFFFAVGLVGVGPQNYFLADWFETKLATKQQKKKKRSNSYAMGSCRDLAESPLLFRNNAHVKPDGRHREIIVPSVAFRYNRFYDWPPDPATTTIREGSYSSTNNRRK